VILGEKRRRKTNTKTNTRVYKRFQLTGIDGRDTDYPFGNFDALVILYIRCREIIFDNSEQR
jgi:hypothetical protein